MYGKVFAGICDAVSNNITLLTSCANDLRLGFVKTNPIQHDGAEEGA